MKCVGIGGKKEFKYKNGGVWNGEENKRGIEKKVKAALCQRRTVQNSCDLVPHWIFK